MIVYVVMKHDMWAEGDSVVDSVWHNEADALKREGRLTAWKVTTAQLRRKR